MPSLTFISGSDHKIQRCIHCTKDFTTDSSHCPHCHQRVDEDYRQFRQSLNQQQGRALLITRLVVGISFACALGLFLST